MVSQRMMRCCFSCLLLSDTAQVASVPVNFIFATLRVPTAASASGVGWIVNSEIHDGVQPGSAISSGCRWGLEGVLLQECCPAEVKSTGDKSQDMKVQRQRDHSKDSLFTVCLWACRNSFSLSSHKILPLTSSHKSKQNSLQPSSFLSLISEATSSDSSLKGEKFSL